MDILNGINLIILVIQFTAYSNAIDFDDGCMLEEPAALQVAFVMDQTGTFFNGKQSFFKEFRALVPKLMDEIDKDYPTTQFALTLFGDWQRDAKPKTSGGRLHNELEGCYTLRTPFTTDRIQFQNNMDKIPILGSGAQENGLSALAFTAADPKLGWIRNLTFPNGKLVRRVLILVTDEDDVLFLGAPNTPSRRGDFKGDGTDRCIKSKPPTHQILKEVFEKYQMTVISLLAENSVRRNLTDLYKAHFEKIGPNIRYCSRAFAIRNQKTLLTDAELKGIYSEGFWAGEDSLGEENMEGISLFEVKEAEIAELTATRAKAGKYDDLIKFVKECLKETDSNSCLFGDPEGFNTLGF